MSYFENLKIEWFYISKIFSDIFGAEIVVCSARNSYLFCFWCLLFTFLWVLSYNGIQWRPEEDLKSPRHSPIGKIYQPWYSLHKTFWYVVIRTQPNNYARLLKQYCENYGPAYFFTSHNVYHLNDLEPKISRNLSTLIYLKKKTFYSHWDHGRNLVCRRLLWSFARNRTTKCYNRRNSDIWAGSFGRIGVLNIFILDIKDILRFWSRI